MPRAKHFPFVEFLISKHYEIVNHRKSLLTKLDHPLNQERPETSKGKSQSSQICPSSVTVCLMQSLRDTIKWARPWLQALNKPRPHSSAQSLQFSIKIRLDAKTGFLAKAVTICKYRGGVLSLCLYLCYLKKYLNR